MVALIKHGKGVVAYKFLRSLEFRAVLAARAGQHRDHSIDRVSQRSRDFEIIEVITSRFPFFQNREKQDGCPRPVFACRGLIVPVTM